MAARKQYLLRVDPKLWHEVEKWAADELRSVNAQVEFILREAVRRRSGRPAGGEPAAGAGAPPGSSAPPDTAAPPDETRADVGDSGADVGETDG